MKVSMVTAPGETRVVDHIPFEVAALNEPMAVARHGVNRCQPKPSDKVAVFGAGPIGLGATIAFKSLGVDHVVVADSIPARLETLAAGAPAVINTALAAAKPGPGSGSSPCTISRYRWTSSTS